MITTTIDAKAATGKTMTLGVAASAILGGFAAVILSIVWGGFWTGLAGSLLWAWFAVPIFGLPVLTIAQAYGVALIARAFRGMPSVPKSEDGFGAAMAKAFFLPPVWAGVILLAGYIVRVWV